MRIKFLIFILLITAFETKANYLKYDFLGDTTLRFSNAGYDVPGGYPNMKLVWSDEFNNNMLDTSVWSFQNGDGCPKLCGWGNNELQYYTSRPQNLFFQSGNLIIKAIKEDHQGRNYTSSKIITKDKKLFKFGRIDIRAKLPYGQGIWPAFWLMPNDNIYGNWPKSGELDLMEMIGRQPNKTHGTLHFGPGPGSIQLTGSDSLINGKLHDEFHVYSLEWKEDEIKWLLDGKVFSTHRRSEFGSNIYPFNESFFFIINLAVGGDWPGNPDTSTTLPQWLIVDYLRLFQ